MKSKKQKVVAAKFDMSRDRESDLASFEVPENNVIDLYSSNSSRQLTQGLSAQQVLPTSRKYISVKVRRRLFHRAGGRCQYRDPIHQRKCISNFQLQVDHVIPLALGGANIESNLRILCGIHNRSEAESRGLRRKI